MAENTEKKQSLFREKSVEAIESPEKLNDYLRVTSPGVWAALATVIIILIGAVIWGIFGHIDSTRQTAVVSENGTTVCLVPAQALQSVIQNRTVTVEGEQRMLSPAALEPEVISETTNVYTMLAGSLSVGDVVYPVPLEEPMPDGIYSGTVLVERLSPFSLLLN